MSSHPVAGVPDERSVDLSRLSAELAGRYELVRELGRGGTAHVHLARDLRHGREVALKVIRREVADAVGLERFRREIRIAASLQHPNILPLLDSGDIDGLPYFVTPYVAGASLRDVLARRGTLPPDETCRIVREIADGLACAHAAGVVHRDVKPGNVLLSEGHAVLTDFGLALPADAGDRLTTTHGTAGGTVLYMSPEQLHGSSEPDARSDVYALGCVAYELLSGEPPFTGRTAWAVMARQAEGSYPKVATIRPDVPAAVDDAIGRALAHDPAARFDDPRDFASALEAARGGGSASAGGGTGTPGAIGEGADDARAAGTAGRGVRIALALACAIAVGAGAMTLLRPGAAADGLDPQRVIVFPLVDTRSGPDAAGEGEEAAIMIGAALDHTEPLRWIDGWDWLDPAVRADMDGWTIQQGTRIARERGARYVIDGRILEIRDSVQVLLRLHDAGDGELVRRSVSGGPSGQVGATELGRRAVVDLLPGLIETAGTVPTDLLAGMQPAAVAAWLQGEREYRRSRFGPALDRFQGAVAQDSTMALAAIRGAQAAGWMLQEPVLDDLLAIALRHGDALPARYADLAAGLRSYYDGDADGALTRLRAALARDPEWSDAHMALGEARYHLIHRDGGGVAEAEAAFRDAARFDPGFTPALVHLAELALARGDLDEGRRLAEEVRAGSPGQVDAARHLGLLRRCADDGPGAVAWADEARAAPLAVLEAAVRSGVGGRSSACAVAAYEALRSSGPPDYAWSALFGLQGHLLATGRIEEAREVIASAVELPRQQHYLFVAAALAGAPFGPRADSAVAALEADLREGVPAATQLWAVGAWSARRGRPAATDRALTLARERRTGGTPGDSLLVAALEGWQALASGDTAAAITRFSGLVPVAPPGELAWGVWQSLAAEHLALAELLLAGGDFAGALRAAAVLEHPQPAVHRAYLPASLRLRASAAQALGQPDEAARLDRRLDDLVSPSARAQARFP